MWSQARGRCLGDPRRTRGPLRPRGRRGLGDPQSGGSVGRWPADSLTQANSRPSLAKYVCAPCSSCKGQLRDIIRYYEGWNRCRILWGGLVELIVNAMVDVPEGFLECEFH